MIRCLLILFLPIAGYAQEALKHIYYGELKYPDHLYQVFITLGDNADVRFYILASRPNEVPLKNVILTRDSLAFERDDFFSAFRGRWSSDRKSVTGNWIGEKKEKHPLRLRLALADTIPGVKPRLEKTYVYQAPIHGQGKMKAAHASQAKVKEDVLTRLGQNVIDQRYGYLHSVLISRQNELVFEEYFYKINGKATWGIQSVTKSLVSALTGIAIQHSEISGTRVRLCESLPAYRNLACNEQNKMITLHDVLSMSTGLEWDEISHDYGESSNSMTQAGNSRDPFRFLLTRPRHEKRFAYNSMNHLVMNKVLRGATRLPNKTEMMRRLIEPLGITGYDLGQQENGVLGDIFLTPREMLKFGLLYLNEGTANGEQIVPRSWVMESTSTKVRVDDELGYGYFWWTTTFPWKDRVVESYFAWGYGGQYIIVVPELELVVVMTGSNWSTDPKMYMMDIMREFVIPACE